MLQIHFFNLVMDINKEGAVFYIFKIIQHYPFINYFHRKPNITYILVRVKFVGSFCALDIQFDKTLFITFLMSHD